VGTLAAFGWYLPFLLALAGLARRRSRRGAQTLPTGAR